MKPQNKVIIGVGAEYESLLDAWENHEWYDMYPTFVDWLDAMNIEHGTAQYANGSGHGIPNVIFPSEQAYLAFKLKYM